MQNIKKFPLISVIVPAYNIELSIDKTLESIISQDYENLEIILVNDASTDLTLKISENILKESERIFKIITHEKNLGVSSARNTGLKNSGGEFICFFDGDDLAEKNFISTLVNQILKYKSDITICGFIDRFKNEKSDVLFPVKLKEPFLRTGDEMLYLRIFKKVVPHLCSMLFRKNFLDENSLKFFDGCAAFEDIEFQLKAFCRAEKVSFNKECLYIYMHSSEMGSIKNADTDSKKLRRYIDSAEAHFRVAEYLSEHSESLKIKNLAENLLMPEALIKRFTILAKNNDKINFKKLLFDKNIKKILFNSRKIIFLKPEIFFKSFIIIFFPNLYFKLRN